jgi:pseudaminic acid synthase
VTAPFAISGRAIGPDHAPYVIAEMSANHGGSFERALRIIEAAAAAGADAIKFQAYTPDSLTIDHGGKGFVIEADNPWRGRRLYELYAEAATPYAWFPDLFAHARARDITPFASPFDADAVAMLEALDAPAYKIASFEAVDLDLIAACAATGKPLVISTGLCGLDDIADALAAARNAGADQVALLKCTSAYPAQADEANLATLPDMADRFDVPVGLSDHSLGNAVAVAACALGASLIEKHVIDSREPPTADSSFSALPDELAALVRDCRTAHAARGAPAYAAGAREAASAVFRRSLYVVADMAEGDAFTRETVRCIRPGYGLAPKCLASVLGRRAARPIARGEPLDWELVR